MRNIPGARANRARQTRIREYTRGASQPRAWKGEYTRGASQPRASSALTSPRSRCENANLTFRTLRTLLTLPFPPLLLR
eukprot:1188525-Prorocentrum_minimum.AAC.2